MRVLQLLDHSLPIQSGYTFRTVGILRGQHAHGLETCQLTTPRHQNAAPASEFFDGLEFHRTKMQYPGLVPLPLLSRWLEATATQKRMLEVCAAFQPDIIHAHSPVFNAIAALKVGRRLGIPVVYEVRAFWEDAAVGTKGWKESDLRYLSAKWLETKALQRANGIIAICKGLKGDIVASIQKQCAMMAECTLVIGAAVIGPAI